MLVGQGQGPGEVGYVSRMQLLANDTVAFIDQSNRRISFLSNAGEPGEQYGFPRFSDGSRKRLFTRLNDGRVLGRFEGGAYTPPTVETGPVRRDSVAIVAYDSVRRTESDTTPPGFDTIAVVPGSELHPNLVRYGAERYPEWDLLRLGRATHVVSDGQRVFIGTTERHEILEYAGNRIARRIRSGVPAAPITDSIKNEFREVFTAMTRALGAPSEALDGAIDNISKWRIADTFEFYGQLHMGSDGTLWAQETHVLPTDPRRYVVYDTTGRALARVELPAWVTPSVLSATEILGSRKDADDVPHVMLWRVCTQP